jgi:PAS domain
VVPLDSPSHAACASEMVQDAELEMRLGKKMTAPKSFPRVALDLATTVERIQQNFCICDPNLPDCPIVFASDGFLEMTEYGRFEVLGRNCRFLQVISMLLSPVQKKFLFWLQKNIKGFACPKPTFFLIKKEETKI